MKRMEQRANRFYDVRMVQLRCVELAAKWRKTDGDDAREFEELFGDLAGFLDAWVTAYGEGSPFTSALYVLVQTPLWEEDAE